MSVTLRERELTKGRSRLYLDYYENGKSDSETLKLFVYDKPKNEIERNHNRQTYDLANNIKAKRIIEVQEGIYGFKTRNNNFKQSFMAYFLKLSKERRNSEGNYGNWLSTYKVLLKFSNGKDISFGEVDEQFLNKFREYLLNSKITKSNTKLAQNSAHSYFNKVKAALNKAFEERIILENPAKRVKGIKEGDTIRQYLSLEELRRLTKTECRNPQIKKAFLFSCLTGLRWSDVQKLKWKEIVYSENSGGYSIQYKQRKTGTIENHPINKEAVDLLGERFENEERVFKGLKYSNWTNLRIKEWMLSAKISKEITFHCSRHTYATLMIANGTDLFTVSKLLGHRDYKTTLLYAKVMDEVKIGASNNLPPIF